MKINWLSRRQWQYNEWNSICNKYINIIDHICICIYFVFVVEIEAYQSIAGWYRTMSNSHQYPPKNDIIPPTAGQEIF